MARAAYTRTRTITVHGKPDIVVVYTNEEEKMQETLQMYEAWFAEEKENKFVGLDLEYTKEDPMGIYDNELAVVQLCMKNHVLVCHFSWFVDLRSVLVNRALF